MTAIPTRTLPATPGTFTVTQYIALFSDTEGAEIKYTVDGSDPKTSDTAKVFDQTKFKADSGFGGAEVKVTDHHRCRYG